MCKKLTVAYGDFIGQRMVGWCVFNGKDYSFLSDKQIKSKLEQGVLVNGLELSEDGKVVIDKEFTPNLMGKSGLAFSAISSADDGDDDTVMNKYYALVKVSKAKAGNQYQFITSRCGTEIFSEAQLKAMLSVMPMGGVRLDGKGKVVVHKGVDIEGDQTGTDKTTEGAS